MLFILIVASFFLGATAHGDYFSQLHPSFEKNPVSGLSLDEATVVMKYHNPQSFLNPAKIMNDVNRPDFNYLSKFFNSLTQASNNLFSSDQVDSRNPSYSAGALVYAKEIESEAVPANLFSNPLPSISNHVFKREAAVKSRQRRSPLTFIPWLTSSGMPFFIQSPTPMMMQSVNPAYMQSPRTTSNQNPNQQNPKPATMQTVNPAMMQSINPAMMQSINPAMMQSMNPAMMQSFLQSSNPLAASNPGIVFVPMMMGPTKMGKREAPNSEMTARSERSPLTYQLVPMSGGMQSPNPMSLPNSNFGYMQNPSPSAMQPSGMFYMVPMESPMGMGKREAPNVEMRKRDKRSPLTYQLVQMPLGMQSANPMALQATNFGFMQSPNPSAMQSSGMVYMIPMASPGGMGKREAPDPDLPSRQKRSPLSVSPVLMSSPNMVRYPMMESPTPMFLVNSGPLMMSSPLLGQPITMPFRFRKREAPNLNMNSRQKRSPLSVSPILMMNPNMVPALMESQSPMILQSSAPLMMPSPVLTQPMVMPMGFGKREAPNPEMHAREKGSP